MERPDVPMTRSESLKSKSTLEKLFSQGKRVKGHPVAARYLILEDDPNLYVAFGAPKGRFRKAVQRNRVKRLTRELFRHHKPEILEAVKKSGKGLALFLVYIGEPDTGFHQLEPGFARWVKRLLKETADVDN